MGMIVYHKLTAEITGPDGREWIVAAEPPLRAPPEGKPTHWEISITEILTRSEDAVRDAETFTYTVPTTDGMFKALGIALDLVPSRHGND